MRICQAVTSRATFGENPKGEVQHSPGPYGGDRIGRGRGESALSMGHYVSYVTQLMSLWFCTQEPLCTGPGVEAIVNRKSRAAVPRRGMRWCPGLTDNQIVLPSGAGAHTPNE